MSVGVVQNFVVRIALLGLNFGTGIVVARSLQPAGRGEQAAMALWPILFAGLATLGVPTALNFCTRRDDGRGGSFLAVAATCALLFGAVAAGLGVVGIPVLLRGYDEAVRHDAQWLLAFTPQVLMLNVVRAHIESKGEFLRSISGQFLMAAWTLVALLALRAAGDLTPVAAALAYFVPGALYTVWLTFRLVPRMRFRIRALAGDARAILSYGLRAYGTDVIAALSLQIDQAVIVAFLSPMQLGLYAVALSLSRIITVAQQAIVMVLFPYASGLPAEEAIALVGRAVRATNAASVAMGALFLLVMPFALPFFYGHAFAQALEILPVLAAEAILAGAAIVLGQAFLATGRPGVVTSVQAVWLATVLALLVAFVPHLDVRGAALALLVGSVARLAFLALMYRRILGRALPRLVPEISDWSMLARKGRATLALGASLLLKESTT